MFSCPMLLFDQFSPNLYVMLIPSMGEAYQFLSLKLLSSLKIESHFLKFISQMRLWSQARQLGAYAANCMWSHTGKQFLSTLHCYYGDF